MLHLFDRTYLEHENFYNTKYFSLIISSVEKPHPISEKLGENFGKVLGFQDYLTTEHQSDINLFWLSLIQKDTGKKKILFADYVTYQERLIEYWKSVFKNPTPAFIYDLYLLQHADAEIKLLMNVDRGDNNSRAGLGHVPKLSFDEFNAIYEKASVVSSLRNRNKDDLGFELLLANYFIAPQSLLSTFFIQRLIRLTWRTWLSDVFSLRNDFLGSYYYLDKKLNVSEFLKASPMAKCFMDPDFHENNSSYILKNYSAAEFKELHQLINPQTVSGAGNPWNDFGLFTDFIFKQQYLELLQADIDNQKGCTYLRNHLANESNQLMASRIYELVRTSDKGQLENFLLA